MDFMKQECVGISQNMRLAERSEDTTACSVLELPGVLRSRGKETWSSNAVFRPIKSQVLLTLSGSGPQSRSRKVYLGWVSRN